MKKYLNQKITDQKVRGVGAKFKNNLSQKVAGITQKQSVENSEIEDDHY